jgi:nucleoside triphosphate diphosphatase
MSEQIDRLLEIMALLRGPDGCPWDRKQTFNSIARCTIEEAYEVVEAVELDDMEGLCEELGDLLLQIVFHAQMANEKGLFRFDDVAKGLADKLIERHPHIFGEENAETAQDVKHLWEKGKAQKRAAKAGVEKRAPSTLDGVSTALPSITRALKISERLALVGFDWQQQGDVVAKFHEETAELEKEIASGVSKEAIEEELGDVLFALVNLGRHLGVDPETALRKCNRKVERRFSGIEARLAAQGRTPVDSNLDEMDRLWNEVKTEEKKG